MTPTVPTSTTHRAAVTRADLHHVGPVTVDEDLADAADRVVELGAGPAAPAPGAAGPVRGDTIGA